MSIYRQQRHDDADTGYRSEDGKEQGAKNFEERLQEKTKEMMKHRPNPLPAEILKELDQMAKHWK